MGRTEDYSHDEGGGGSSRVRILQANRDPESNWEVDLAKNLEDYLLKICSGELTAEDDHGHHSVNFAEAALLLQGSIQVYSRKVEYLYTLVTHALEFISQTRQYDEESSVQTDKSKPRAEVDCEEYTFLGLDHIPEEGQICLDATSNKEFMLNQFVKPPANLLVLEGDCLDTSNVAGELDSYLLSSCNFYGDFLLLDPCDAEAVRDFIKANDVWKDHKELPSGSSMKPKTHDRLFSSPLGRSGGNRHKSSIGKKQSLNMNEVAAAKLDVDGGTCEELSETDDHHEWESNVGCSNSGGSSDEDDDDPWKPLNPHEPGNLKVKPFKKGRRYGEKLKYNCSRSSTKYEFPLAKFDGIISPEFGEAMQSCHKSQENCQAPQSPPLYEKLRQSLVLQVPDTFSNLDDMNDESNDNGEDNDIPDFDQADFNLPQDFNDIEMELPFGNQKHGDGPHLDQHDPFAYDDLNSNASLEDLCRSHLDALLASIAETEKQTELAARVSTWKQRIEHSLEEQDSRPPFDIHLYGQKVLDKLTASGDHSGNMVFTDVVRGLEKHEIARTFSAMLQLVNNGDIDLDRKQSKHESICYTAENPFSVKLLDHGRRKEQMEVPLSNKSIKMPSSKGMSKSKASDTELDPSVKLRQNGKPSVKIGKGSVIRLTPEGKRRRRSQLIESVKFVTPE